MASGRPGGRRIARRSLVFALIALLAIAVAAAAIGLGVPGIRIQLQLGPPRDPDTGRQPGALVLERPRRARRRASRHRRPARRWGRS